ncbi:ABC transporter ATP-binding protein [Gephyromycinifex aptenodytis]|uniref:ABC transporter ATP-binding protein n=1 Tax=Gephyromycinifex aptenodytis TaxID=2716227 RepID=UPI001B2FFDE2|nr:ABC transporter ATP-binding protein [Gephyromycinifex aptenodytis]
MTTTPHPNGSVMTSSLSAEHVTLGYDDRVVAEGLDLHVPDGGFTVIVGPNACGKSTLLRSLARLLTPTAGRVVLDGDDIHRRPTREVARRIGLLPQSSIAPDLVTVRQLVSRGRSPHQSLLRQWSRADEEAVAQAMRLASVSDLADRQVDQLSGGQRQRVWLALVLAQETPLILLDEPTTYLDLTHQVELLDLCRRLQRHGGRTLVAVLHDLNQAARYATHLVAMSGGRIVAEGDPHDIITPDLTRDVFGLDCHVCPDPVTGTPMIVPPFAND